MHKSLHWIIAAGVASACTGGSGKGDSAGGDTTAGAAESGTTESASETSASNTSSPGQDDAAGSGLSADSGDEAGDDSDEGGGIATGGTSSPCLGDGIELTNVVIEVATNRVFGEDAPVEFDPEMDWGCVQNIDGMFRVLIQHGPPAFGEPGSLFMVEIYDGARVYDLATDPAPPGTGNAGLIQLSYMVPFEPAAVASFGTINQAATGTVDVLTLPVDGEIDVELHAAGEIAGSDGWVFDLHITATVPVD